MNLKEFSEFFHFFRSEIKIYPIGYNIGIYRTNCIISGIIWVIGMGMGGRNGRWAQLQIVLCKVIIDSNY